MTRLTASCALATLLLITVLPSVPAGAQADARIVLSELHFNPASVGEAFPDYDDREDAEFIEIANWGDSSVDLDGWCIDEGIDYCFGAGDEIGAGQRLVGARKPDDFNAAWGRNADFDYDGKLSNSSELVRLIDPQGAVVDQVEYQSTDTWPVTPDGQGPSLERIDLSSDESGPRAWAASSGVGGTPGQPNSAANANGLPPLVTSHSDPGEVGAGAATSISATIVGATGAVLEYKVNFDAVQSLVMSDANGSWSATIPGAQAGDLVRYRVVAAGAAGERSGPRADDTIDWWGYVVSDGVDTAVPKLHWFTRPADFAAAYGNPQSNTPCNGGLCPAVIALDGMVWDNVGFRVAGLTSRNLNKKNYRLDFPHGHRFEADFLSEPVDVITLDGQSPNYEMLREKLSWEFFVEQDHPVIGTGHGHIRQNGDFFGLYLMREEQDGRWRNAQGFADGSYYKFEGFGAKRGWGGTWQKLEGFDVDFSLLDSLRDCVNGSVATRRNCLPELMDVPQVINEIASTIATMQLDQREFNWHIWHDTDGTGLWQLFPDDLDRSMGSSLSNPGSSTKRSIDRCTGADGPPPNEICAAFMSVPEYEAMVFRRLRSMADGSLSDPKWPARVQELAGPIAPDWQLDAVKFGRTATPLAVAADQLADWYGEYVTHLRAGGHYGKVPAAQDAAATVEIEMIHQNAGDDVEFIRLRNTSNKYVDVSDWSVDGLTPIRKGAVLAPNGSLDVIVDEAAFIDHVGNARSHRTRVGGSVGPVIVLLRNDGSVAAQAGVLPDAPVHLNEWNAVDEDTQLLNGDDFFGQIPGNGGDWFELVIATDHVDLRGWSLLISDREDDVHQVRDQLVFSDDVRLSDLRAGTIITVSESLPDDPSFAPIDGDWTMNFQFAKGSPGAFFTDDSQENFDTNAENWQLAIVSDQGEVMFGPAGEGTAGVAGILDNEIGELEADPAPGLGPDAGFDDGRSSTFGAPNFSGGRAQDFSVLRAWFADVDSSGAVDLGDVQAMLDAGTGLAEPVAAESGDINFDGTVNLLDALLLTQALDAQAAVQAQAG